LKNFIIFVSLIFFSTATSNIAFGESLKDKCVAIEKSFPDTTSDWNARGQECICFRAGKSVDCGIGKGDADTLKKALGIPAKVEVYRGCRATTEYRVLEFSNQQQVRCKCTNKIPAICEITLYCDGSDSGLVSGENKAACPQIKGVCPSLAECIDDEDVNPDELQDYKPSSNPASTISR
jgi:hypothetical protein